MRKAVHKANVKRQALMLKRGWVGRKNRKQKRMAVAVN